MSMEITVLSDERLSSIMEWQRAIDAEGYPLQFSSGRFDDEGGSLKGQLRGSPISLEYRFESFVQLKQSYKDINFGGDWKLVLALPWIHGFDGLTAAWMGASAYAQSVSGVIFDPQEGKVFSPDEALKVVHDIERTRPEAEAALRNFKQQLSAKS